MSELAEDAPTFLSTLAARAPERRRALLIVVISAGVFVVLEPLAKLPLTPIWGFIPVYETLVVINDLITAVLLLGQFAIVRSRAILILAIGYLFTASMATFHALTFPGLFSPSGLLGAGPQTTAWLYMAWHGGFPAFVVVYAVLKGRRFDYWPRADRKTVLACAIAAPLLAAGVTALVTGFQDWLPAIMEGNRYSPEEIVVAAATWGLNLLALAILWQRRPQSVIDLWLMVVMCAWVFDVALSAVVNAERFDLGFYAGRIYGLLAVSFVLMVLLLENGQLYANLVKAHAELRRLATADPLTGIANRRAFDLAIDREWRRAARAAAPLSLLMIDVDYFKRFNDSRGHVAGDQCLREIAAALAGALKRAGDLAARYGGEEFAVILSHAEAAEARAIGEALCRRVDELGIRHPDSPTAAHVTISVGVASQPPRDGAAHAGQSALVEAADRALYAAKRAGRHRVSDGVAATGT
jgi:diguanylate cyclase (GGDEF)-like protein